MSDAKFTLQSETIDWLRFPLVIFVIFIHSFGLPENVNLREIDFSVFSGMDVYNIIRVVVRKIAGICNSCFFLFSGYLFFFKVSIWNKEIYFEKIKTRIKTLLIPYMLWNTIQVMITPVIIIGGRIVKKDGDWNRLPVFFNTLIEKGIWNIFLHYNTWGTGTNILGWPRPSMGPFSVPMWFLQTLIVLTVLTPIIYLICKYLKLYGVILLGLLYYTGIWFSIPGFGIASIFFFTLGAYFSISNKNLIIEFRRYKLFWYIITALTLLPSVYFDYDGITTYNYFSPIFILAMIISTINMVSSLLEKKKIKNNKLFSQATFFIYAIHTVLILSFVGLAFDFVFKNKNPVILTIRYFTVPIAAAFLCLLIYYIMKKTMPKILNLLSGNR